jgi:hypothetical protein
MKKFTTVIIILKLFGIMFFAALAAPTLLLVVMVSCAYFQTHEPLVQVIQSYLPAYLGVAIIWIMALSITLTDIHHSTLTKAYQELKEKNQL